MASRAAAAIVVLVVLVCGAVHQHPVAAATMKVDTTGELLATGLSTDFYDATCPYLEVLVKRLVDEAFAKDAGIAPALIRILFHDCFPQGCDASVLLGGNSSEQLLGPNLTLRPTALKLIEDIRAAAHAACGPIVSCADILSLATRDALVDAGGPTYDVPLGRRDGPAPASSDLVFTLPAPFFDVPTLTKSFSDRNLSVTDLVALSGAHSFGVAHCSSFSDRFTPATDTDPAIDPALAAKLKAKCALDTPEGTVNQTLDVRTPNVFDNKYYVDLLNRQGLFTSDQDMHTDARTKPTVARFAVDQAAFFDQFVFSVVKMGQINVLTGNQGQIRTNCSAPNAARTGGDELPWSVLETVAESLAL